MEGVSTLALAGEDEHTTILLNIVQYYSLALCTFSVDQHLFPFIIRAKVKSALETCGLRDVAIIQAPRPIKCIKL